MPKIKVKLLRPLDGAKEGSVRAFDKPDADRLASFGAVQILGQDKPPKPRAARKPARVIATDPVT